MSMAGPSASPAGPSTLRRTLRLSENLFRTGVLDEGVAVVGSEVADSSLWRAVGLSSIGDAACASRLGDSVFLGFGVADSIPVTRLDPVVRRGPRGEFVCVFAALARFGVALPDVRCGAESWPDRAGADETTTRRTLRCCRQRPSPAQKR